jgi:transposase
MAPGNRKNPQRADASDSQFSIMEFTSLFPDDETCLTYLWNTRYNLDGDMAHCERCGEIRQFRRYEGKQQRQAWTCTACGYQVYPTAGTIFHKSSTSLRLWFYAMYLMTSTRCGISAKQLERELGVTYKTAWRIFNLIRNELMTQDDDPPLTGVVEMDETYIGGKPRASDRVKFAKHPAGVHSAAVRWSHDKKLPVFGAAQRKRQQWLADDPEPTMTAPGRVTAFAIPSKQKATIMAHVDRRVSPDAVIHTDDAHIYGKLPHRHETVNHSAKEYVRGDVHTQTIDGFWSTVKNGITGVHHGVSAKWLQGYLNEYV